MMGGGEKKKKQLSGAQKRKKKKEKEDHRRGNGAFKAWTDEVVDRVGDASRMCSSRMCFRN